MNEDIDVLLIEDNPLDVDLTLRELRSHHLANTIHVARDTEEALAFLFREATGAAGSRLKLILLDTHLPKMGGLEVLRKIRSDESTKTVPVVILTSSEEDRRSIETYNLGVTAYLRKPLAFEAFCETVRKARLFWLVTNEPALAEA